MAKANIIKPLQITQNRILKTLAFKPCRYPTDLLHNNLGLLKVKDIHSMRLSSLVYKYTKSMASPIFHQNFNPVPLLPNNMRTRTNIFFSTTKHNNKYGQLMLNNYCYKLWQNLPANVKISESLYFFKKNLKSHLLYNYSAN